VSRVEVRSLGADEARGLIDALAEVLVDCVAGGASVSYMAGLSHSEARAVFEGVVAEVERGRRLLFAAFIDGALVGTVQVVHALPPNQPHRADVAKLLVHRSARRRGIGRLLMEHAEAESTNQGKTLLVLDTVTGSPAERLYQRLGWTKTGVIPDYALDPDGRPCDTTILWKQLRPPISPPVMADELDEAVRAAAESGLRQAERAQRIADLIRTSTGRRWIGVYKVTPTEVVNLAWSGPAPPAHPRFPAARGLTGAAISVRATVVSNDVARDPRYLTALASTGSEMIVPVIVGDEVVGTLDVEDETTDAFSDDDRRLFERIARELGPLYA
jgi:putative methionine-R-sulfoxide reductase with GAF domain/GNAT superfamily N-acetyltransferase